MTKKNKLSMLRRDDSGNIAVMSAVTFGMLAIMVGAAVEYTSLTNRSQDMQNAIDIAVLAAARSGKTEERKLKRYAKSVFMDNFEVAEGEKLVRFDANLSEDNILSLETRIKKRNMFAGLIGKKNNIVTVEAASLLSSEAGLDIALVLDRTGSMAGANMNALKSAAAQFIGDLQSDGGDVRLSVVPFADYVNVGVDTMSKPWLDLPVLSLAGTAVECTMQSVSNSTCQPASGGTAGTAGTAGTGGAGGAGGAGGTGGTGGTGGMMYGSVGGSGGSVSVTVNGVTINPWSMTWPDVTIGSNGAYCTASTDPSEDSGNLVEECIPRDIAENWLGCVGSRTAPYNTQSAVNGQKIPLIYDRSCGQPLTELTDDLPRVRADISDLTASGMTYIPAGLQWGWRTLTPEAPFDSAGDESRRKLLILMTDGDNTISQSGTTHDGTDLAAANALTLDLCNEIKSSGVQLATVSYKQNGNDDVLQKCASSPNLYFNARNATKLRKAFESAVESIRDVRLVY